jgi:hypothetical protein
MLFKETLPVYFEYPKNVGAKYIDRKDAFVYVEVGVTYNKVTIETLRNNSSHVVKE